MRNEADITEKIRSAIKAKLGQIGAYVDDELPDYIMVMIANKKTIQQITDDLSLFLGSKTQRFTEWLDKLLKKLQAVDGEEKKEGKEEKKEDNKEEKKEKSVKADKKGGKEPKKAKKRRSDESKPKEKPKKQRSLSPKPSTSADVPIEDAIEVQQQDNTEFEEVVKATKPKLSKDDKKLIKTSTGENVPVRKVRQELVRHNRSKRRGVSSVVAKVNLQPSSDSDSDSDERYNSKVSVVRRQYTRSERGSKKLLVRACHEATSSVEELVPQKTYFRRYEHGYRSDANQDRRQSQERRHSRERLADQQIPSNQEQRPSEPLRSNQEKVLYAKPIKVACSTQTSPKPEETAVEPKSDVPEIVVEERQNIYDYDERQTVEYAKQRRQTSPKRSEEFTRPVMMVDTDSDASVEEVIDSRKVQCSQVYDRYRARNSPLDSTFDDPKFIVTLDGAAPSICRTITVSDDETKEESIPTPMTSTPLDSKRVSWEDMDVDAGEDKIAKSLDELIPQQKKQIRCRYWPACKNSSECQYVHPSTSCRMFPQCSFGNKCLYIHPNCRYDANCLNQNCPYMHSSKRDPVTIATAQIIKTIPRALPMSMPMSLGATSQCRFYPNCTNFDCPYVHPKHCRYGADCRNRKDGCPFEHPEVKFDRFKWCNSEKFVISHEENTT